MLPTIMSRGPTDLWTRTPRSIAPFSASAPSHHNLSSADFITNIAESNFWYTQVFNAEHLRRILAKYATYYSEVRTHVSLGKDAPSRRPVERFGDIVAHPVLGGLHHRYARI